MTKRDSTDRADLAKKIIVGIIIGAAIVLGVMAIWAGRGGGKVGPDFKLDLSQYMKTDPALILYRELTDREFDTGFAEARAISIAPDGKIYVAGDKAIHIFDAAGAKLSDRPLTDSPRALCVGTDGWIYVAFTNSIVIYRPDGSSMALPSVPSDAVLTSIAHRGPDIYAADASNRSVLHYHKLALHSTIKRDDTSGEPKGFNVPSPYFDMAIDDRGDLYVADPGRQRIVKMDRGGKHIAAWEPKRSMRIEAFCGCCNPVNIALTPAGQIVTAEKGLARVKLYNTEGTFLGVVAGVESFPGHDPAAISGDVGPVLDVAVDAAGRVLVLDCRTAKVRIFERKTK